MKRILSLVLVILMAVLPCAFAEEKPTIGIVIQKENGAFLEENTI